MAQKRVSLVTLVKMTESDYEKWEGQAIIDYASDKVRAGNDMEEGAVERSRKEFAELLPNGPNTAGHFMFSVVDEGTKEKVGMLWLGAIPRTSDILWVYDVRIDPGRRGMGLGTVVMKLAEDKARELGKKRIGLQVFGHNEGARRLYEKLGYRATNIAMAKDL